MSEAPGYQGFVAGIFSGITKLTVGHPFDTVKVRLQIYNNYKGPLDCLYSTIRNEGIKGLYKGASPPLVGWIFMDSVMLGSLHNFRTCLKQRVWPHESELPFKGKVIAGVLAGWVVSFVAAPIEQIKARLQVQLVSKNKLYSGPIDCAQQLFYARGLAGLYQGLFATLIFRTNFCFWWGSYDIFTKWFEQNTKMNTPAINFWAGGLSASVFWTVAYPADVVKQQIMTDNPVNRRYRSWMQAARAVYARGGVPAFFRGFTPSIIRSFPANASALAAFEFAMRLMHKTDHPHDPEAVLE